MPQPGLPRLGWEGILAILFWAQFVFGVSSTLWRYSLIQFSGWQAYPSGVSKEFDQFIQLAAYSIPAGANLVFLSPPGDTYTARYARLGYFLYPRRILWLGLGPRTSGVSRWTPTDPSPAAISRIVAENQVSAVLVNDAPDNLLVGGKRIEFDATDYIVISSR